MSTELLSKACSLLSRMPSSSPWNEGTAELYTVGLQAIPEPIVMDVVTRAVLTCSNRPSVPELVTIASDMLAGNRTTPAEAWEEVERFLTNRGLYCRQDPIHPNVYREGEPRFSDSVIEHAVARM